MHLFARSRLRVLCRRRTQRYHHGCTESTPQENHERITEETFATCQFATLDRFCIGGDWVGCWLLAFKPFHHAIWCVGWFLCFQLASIYKRGDNNRSRIDRGREPGERRRVSIFCAHVVVGDFSGYLGGDGFWSLARVAVHPKRHLHTQHNPSTSTSACVFHTHTK